MLTRGTSLASWSGFGDGEERGGGLPAAASLPKTFVTPQPATGEVERRFSQRPILGSRTRGILSKELQP